MTYLGMTATDKVTGFTGIVIGFVYYITGCNQCLIAPKAETPSKMPDGVWIDENRLEFQATFPPIVITTDVVKGADTRFIQPPATEEPAT